MLFRHLYYQREENNPPKSYYTDYNNECEIKNVYSAVLVQLAVADPGFESRGGGGGGGGVEF